MKGLHKLRYFRRPTFVSSPAAGLTFFFFYPASKKSVTRYPGAVSLYNGTIFPTCSSLQPMVHSSLHSHSVCRPFFNQVSRYSSSAYMVSGTVREWSSHIQKHNTKFHELRLTYLNIFLLHRMSRNIGEIVKGMIDLKSY